MKKIAIVSSLMMCLSISGMAQQFYWGINGGLLSNTSSSDKQSRPKNPYYIGDRKLGTTANFGINFGYQFKSRWGIELQLQGVNIRSKDKMSYPPFDNSTLNPTNLEEQLRYSYLRVPILASFRITNSGSKIQLQALAGGNIGFLLNDNSKLVGTNAEGKEYVNSASYRSRSVMNSDIGVQLGLRASKNISKQLIFFVDVAYYNGFTYRYDEILSYFNYDQYVYNQYLTTNIGIKLDVGKKTKI